MEPLSEEFVERTWREVAGFSPARANKGMLAMGKNQPDLLAFLIAFTADLRQEVKELAIYIAFVVYTMFLDVKGTIPKFSSREIMGIYDANALFLETLEGTHERIATVQVSKQPYVMKYVLEALMEDAEEDGIALTEEDIGFLFVLFKTEIELLDSRS